MRRRKFITLVGAAAPGSQVESRSNGNVMPIRKAEAEATAPSHAAGSGDIVAELRRQYDRLTPSQKSIAEYIIEHSQEVAFSTVDQMAERVDVNPSTIVRFAYRLGLNGFTDLQERMQELVRGQLSRTGAPISESQAAGHLEGTSFGTSLSHDWQNLHHTLQLALSRAPVLECRPAQSDNRSEDFGPPTIPALQVPVGIQRPTLSLPDHFEQVLSARRCAESTRAVARARRASKSQLRCRGT